jgi:hypothetical protein
MTGFDTFTTVGQELAREQLDAVDGGMSTTPRWVFCMYYAEICYPERY